MRISFKTCPTRGMIFDPDLGECMSDDLIKKPNLGVRTVVASGTPLHAGTLVYRVFGARDNHDAWTTRLHPACHAIKGASTKVAS